MIWKTIRCTQRQILCETQEMKRKDTYPGCSFAWVGSSSRFPLLRPSVCMYALLLA